MLQTQKKHEPVYNWVNNQSLETENKMPQTQKNHEPVYNRVTNQSLETENKKNQNLTHLNLKPVL